MKEIDEMGLFICRAQANLFVASLTLTECSSAVFLRRFMNSSVAERMDKGFFLFEASSNDSVISEINEEFGETNYGKVKFSENEMYWMGYLYRYWCYTYGKTSKQVYRIIKPTELRTLFFPYHSIDCSAAIERILEAKGQNEEDSIEKGVAILRRLINQRKSS